MTDSQKVTMIANLLKNRFRFINVQDAITVAMEIVRELNKDES